MTGDYTLTLPVMLAVAIATAVSRALSYGTIYTTKLLRRGTDIDRPTPWHALQDLKVADAMRPFPAPLAAPAAPDGTGSRRVPATITLPGPVTGRRDPQALSASESLARALRQLVVYGRDGLPVLSADGQHVQGWITNNRVLQTIARKIHTSQAQVTQPSSPPSGHCPTPKPPCASRPPHCADTRSWRSPSPAAHRPQGSRCAPPPGHRAAPPSQCCTTTEWPTPPRHHPSPRRPGHPAHPRTSTSTSSRCASAGHRWRVMMP